MTRLVLAFVALLSAPLAASPARVGAIDNGLGLVPDQTDVASYPQLVVNHTRRLRIDYLGQDRECEAWATVALGRLGALAVWRARPALADTLFGGLAGVGFVTSGGLDGVAGDEQAEFRVATPAARAGLTWGLTWNQRIALGLAGQWSQTVSSRSAQMPASAALATRDAMVQGTFGGLTMTAWDDRLYSNQVLLTPGLGLSLAFGTLDLGADLAWSKVDNARRETYAAGGAITGGRLAAGLSGESASWRGRGKLIVPWGERTINVAASYARLGMEATRRADADFDGSAVSGWDVPTDTHHWQSTPLAAAVGLASRPTAKSYVILAAGYKAESAETVWEGSAARLGGAGAGDRLVDRRTTHTQSSWKMPLTVGLEMEAYKFLVLRAMGEMALAGESRGRVLEERMSAADGSLAYATSTHTGEDQAGVWALAVGAGFNLGQVTWDHRLDLSRQRLDGTSYTTSLTCSW